MDTIIKAFMAINMIFACVLLYTAQKDSGFFFDYILVTLIIYIIPHVSLPTFLCNMVINIVGLIVVLVAEQYDIGFQDVIDLFIMHVVCLFVNYTRLLSFLRNEQNKCASADEMARLYQDSRHDPLTHALNRNALQQDMSPYLNVPLCLAIVD